MSLKRGEYTKKPYLAASSGSLGCQGFDSLLEPPSFQRVGDNRGANIKLCYFASMEFLQYYYRENRRDGFHSTSA